MNRIYYLRSDRKVVYNPDGSYYVSRGEPLVCIVSERNSETGDVRYGYSIVHMEDRNSRTYSKSEGRRLALLRFYSDPLMCNTKDQKEQEINRTIIKHFSDTVGKENGTARKTSHKWLRLAQAKSKSAAKLLSQQQ